MPANFVIKVTNRANYILAIEKAQNEGELNDFYCVIADAVDESIDDYLEMLSNLCYNLGYIKCMGNKIMSAALSIVDYIHELKHVGFTDSQAEIQAKQLEHIRAEI